LVTVSGYQRLPTATKTPHKSWFFTPEYLLKPPFHGGNTSSNLVRDASLQSKHSFKNKPSALTGWGLFFCFGHVLVTISLTVKVNTTIFLKQQMVKGRFDA